MPKKIKPKKINKFINKVIRLTHRDRHTFHDLLLAIILLPVLVVAGQMLYPGDKALPWVWIGEVPVGGLSYEEITEKLRLNYNNVPISVDIPGKKTYKTTSAKAGLTLKYNELAQSALDYPLNERLVPFSIIPRVVQKPIVLRHSISEEPYKILAETLVKECSLAPKDAQLTFESGNPKVIPAENGQQCNSIETKQSMQHLQLKRTGTTLTLKARAIKPTFSTAAMQEQLMAAKQTIASGLTIASESEKWEINQETITSWLTVKMTGNKVELATKTDEVKKYLETLKDKLYIAPGNAQVNYIDGVEVARSGGNVGFGIDTTVTAQRVDDVLLGKTKTRTAWVQLAELQSITIANRHYTPTPKGLQALITQWDKEHNGRYGIMVRDLSGKGMSAEFNPDMSFVTASTFKMFLAYAVLHKVEIGEISMDTQTNLGLSVRACLGEMILHSTNECSISFFSLVGWGYAHNFIANQFPATSLDNDAYGDGEKHSTVRDEVTFMERLQGGQLMNGTYTDYLLDLLKRQIWRGGIPTGLKGVTVANKVGFYNGYKHDVGIIYSPRGTYILGIMSYGGNDGQFVDLSRKVDELMNR